MGKKEITGDSSSKKEKKATDKSDKKSKKDRSQTTKQPSQPSTDIVSEPTDPHADGMAVDEPVSEEPKEPKKTKKASKKRRLELETSGDLSADVHQVEDSEVPKKKKKKNRPESHSNVQTSTSMNIDAQHALDDAHPLETKGAGPSDARQKQENKPKKNKKKGEEQPDSSSPVPLLSPEDDTTVGQLGPRTGKEDKKKRKKEKNKEKNSESLPEAEARVSSKKKSKSKALSDETTPSKPRKNRLDFADPQADESLDPQARKALEYAFTQFDDPSEWKFNKAKQNWIIRNVWSSELIPEIYFSLAVEYISKIQGGSRDKLKEQCDSVLNEPVTSTESNDADTKDTAKATESVSKADSLSPKPKSILKSSATSTSQPLAGAIIVAPIPEPTVDIKRQRAKLLLAALTSSS